MILQISRKIVLFSMILFLGTLLGAQSFTEMSAFDIRLGNFRVIMNPVNGSFSVAHEGSAGSTVVLQREGYPYGSQFRLSRGGRILRLEEIVQFAQVARDDESLFVYYELKEYGNLTLGFRILSGDSISVSLGIMNAGDENLYAQILLDTILGESSGNHFIIQGESVSRETGFVLNPELQDQRPTLKGIEIGTISGLSSVITPILHSESRTSLQVVLANLRRLAESSESFSVNPNRNFNLLPFSVNDSAILLTASVQAKSQAIFGFVLAPDILSQNLIERALTSPSFDTVVRVGNASSSNLPSPLVNENRSDSTGSAPTGGVDLSKMKESLGEVNLLLLKIDQQLLNSTLELDLEFFREQLDTIRRGSGL